MKTFLKYLSAIVIVCCSASCSDYLDEERHFRDLQTEERIFSKKDYSEQWLATCYSMLLGDNMESVAWRISSITSFSDDMVFNEGLDEGRRGSLFRSWKLGEYQYIQEELGYFAGGWKLSYDGIRQASILINNIDINQELTPEEITDMKGQARFVRGYLYWLLLRKYGPCPILPDGGADYTKTYEELSYPRMHYDSVANYIAREMEQAARELPIKRTSIGAARATRGAALALRAKVLVYAASPLANGNTEMASFIDHKGQPLISQTYDERKWARAAAACRDLIEYSEANDNLYGIHVAYRVENSTDYAYPQTITPPYHPEYSERKFPDGWADIDPFESYRSEFDGDVLITQNKDLIFTRGRNARSGDGTEQADYRLPVSHQLPASCGGWNCHGLTQKQTDAYDMADGTPFDTNNRPTGFTTASNVGEHPYDHLGLNVSMQYANREPRFYASVGFSGDYWACTSAQNTSNRNRQVFFYRGLIDGRQNATERWQLTGIAMKKYVNPADCMVDGGKLHNEYEFTIRYADILLLYAESLNELTTDYQIPSWDGQTVYTIRRDADQMRRGIKPVRMRAGVPDYEPAVYGNIDQLRKAIKHERQLEFLGESQRYYDLRRWKDAPEEEGSPIYGCNVNMNLTHANEFYVPMRVADVQANFAPRMYFWPVLKSELKRNKNLTQAPGWETFD